MPSPPRTKIEADVERDVAEYFLLREAQEVVRNRMIANMLHAHADHGISQYRLAELSNLTESTPRDLGFTVEVRGVPVDISTDGSIDAGKDWTFHRTRVQQWIHEARKAAG